MNPHFALGAFFVAAVVASCGGKAFLAVENGGPLEGGSGAGGVPADASVDVTTGGQSATTSGGSGAGVGGTGPAAGGAPPVDAGRAGSGGSSGRGGSMAAGGRAGASGSGGSAGASGRGGAGGVAGSGAGGASGAAGMTMNDAGPAPCSTALSYSVCVECCNDRYPQALPAFQDAAYGCACSDCYAFCSATLCDTNISRPSGACVMCINQAGDTLGCSNRYGNCATDPVCAPYLACITTCR